MNNTLVLKIKFIKDNFAFSDQQLAIIFNVSRKTVHNWITGKSKPNTKSVKRLVDITQILVEWVESGYPISDQLGVLDVENLVELLKYELSTSVKDGVLCMGSFLLLESEPKIIESSVIDTRPDHLKLISFKHNLKNINLDELSRETLDILLLQIDHNLSVITLTPEQRNLIISPYYFTKNLIIIDVFKFEYDRVVKETLIEIDSNLFTTPLSDADRNKYIQQKYILTECRKADSLQTGFSNKADYYSAIAPVIKRLLTEGIPSLLISKTLSIPKKIMEQLASDR
ncbi:hypothetical protein [Photobacterium kishitanii]|uniref:HTH cro/C1-type domain-containing protein n=1 Tax=Photobacterium kishitanii TaxID=318456 RepID=A0A2T3KLA0_9GAMM|nr:hypothetical protein [Photobacterium kishitanii]PSV00495.1 hypothetical protein C9J27_05005 [Photobacterium kishitanii]